MSKNVLRLVGYVLPSSIEQCFLFSFREADESILWQQKLVSELCSQEEICSYIIFVFFIVLHIG